MLSKKDIKDIVDGKMKYFFGSTGELIVAINQSEYGYDIKEVVKTLYTLKSKVESSMCVELWKSKSKDGKWFVFEQVQIESNYC